MTESTSPASLEAAVSQSGGQPKKEAKQTILEQAQPGQLILANAAVYRDAWAGHGFMAEDYVLLDPHQRTGIYIGDEGVKLLSNKQIRLLDEWLAKGVPAEKSYERKSIFGVKGFEWKLLSIELSAFLSPVIARYLKAEAEKQHADELYKKDIKPHTDALESAKNSLEAALLENKILPESDEPLPQPRIEAPEAFDIKSIGAETRQRLEGIVLGTGEPQAIADFLIAFGEEKRAKPYLAAIFLREITRTARVSNAGEALLHELEDAKDKGFLDKGIIAGLAALVYQYAIKEKEHELAFEIGRDFLNLPKEILGRHRLDALYATLVGERMEHRSFDPNLTEKDRIAKLTEGLPADVIKAYAQLAYSELMTRKTKYHNPAEDFLAAGRIAVMMGLETDLAEQAGKGVAVYYLEELKKMREQRDWDISFGLMPNAKEHTEAAVRELGVPVAAVRPLALHFFENELFWPAKANKIADEFYGLQPEDTMPIVQNAYEHSVAKGQFDFAHALRIRYPEINGGKISAKDLQLLGKIQNSGRNVPPLSIGEEE